MKPVFIINGFDYTPYIEKLQPASTKVYKTGSGRSVVDGRMWLYKLASKDKWTVVCLTLGELLMVRLKNALAPDFAAITLLDPGSNRYVTKQYYTSTLNEGIQRYNGTQTIYEGVTFDITEQ